MASTNSISNQISFLDDESLDTYIINWHIRAREYFKTKNGIMNNGIINIPCTFCSMKFTSKDKLNKHIKARHKKKISNGKKN